MGRFALDKINSWEDFKAYAESMSNTKSMGDAFEHLTKLYFKINPIYKSKYEKVWLLDEVPEKDLEYLELPRQDLGIDLIAKTGSEYHAIQCKYHSDKNKSVRNKEVSTFTSLLANKKNLSHGYICSTAIKTSTNYNKLDIENISNVLYDTWSTLDKDFFDKARKLLENKKIKEDPYNPFPHQENAIKLAHKHFIKEKNSRGKLIFPCGSGKSLTGFWMMEKLVAKSTLVAVPSLSLIKQTLEVYLKQVVAKNKNVKWLCICSDEGIGKGDDVITYTKDLPVPCTTDKDYIKDWLIKNKNENIIIFTTYQSGRIIADISKSLKYTFDLGIYDEAHKTVGKNENLFSYLLFEENISVKHRIFMTATERFYRGVHDDVLTMDDPDDYGDVFCYMSFKEAIEEDLLTDYKIITIEVKKEEVAAFIKDNNLVKSNKRWGNDSEARSLASMLALRKAMKTLPIKNVVSFHSSIERATRNKEVQQHITESYNYKPIDTYHVSGKLPTTKRNDIVQEFAKSDRALITNSRCLTEGVDVPNIDCIVFADPRKSKVDIVQALGRALRKKDGKDWGYVMLPVIYDQTSREIDNENFQEILNIVRGLAANDERIIEEFKDKSHNSGRVIGAREEIFSIVPALLEETELVDNLNIKLWENLSRFNWMSFEKALNIVKNLKINNWNEYRVYKNLPKGIPRNPNIVYKSTWVNWGHWLGTGNISKHKMKFKSFHEASIIARKNNLKTGTEYSDFARKYGKKYLLPVLAYKTYKDNWKGWADFLGAKPKYRDYLPYEKAKKYIQSLNLKNENDLRKAYKAIDFPINIPKKPDRIYKEWKGMGEYLGTGNFHSYKNLELRDYNSAKKYVSTKGLKSRWGWIKYFKTVGVPKDIPLNPDLAYKDTGWIDYSDFLGKEIISNQEKSKSFLSYEDARKIVVNLKLKNQKQWKEYVKTNKLSNIPSHPHIVYKNKGWKNLHHWIGNINRKRIKGLNYLPFLIARNFVRKLNLKSVKEWNKYSKVERPIDIPSNPQKKYITEWKGWSDFLGKED